MHHHIEITGGTATGAGLALTSQLDPLTVRDTSRDTSCQPPIVDHGPLAVAGGAGIVDHRSGAVAIGARLGKGERTLIPGGQTSSLTYRALSRRRSRLG